MPTTTPIEDRATLTGRQEVHSHSDAPHLAAVSSPIKSQPANWLVRAGWIGAFSLATFAGGWWLGNRQEAESHKLGLDEAPKASDTKTFKITAEPVRFQKLRRYVEAIGTIHGYEELTLAAKVDGRIKKIHHDMASRVAPGTLLLEIDPTDAKLAVDQAEQALQAELARWGFAQVPDASTDLQKLPTVQSARLKADLAQSKFQRLTSLQSANAVALEDLDQARSDAQVTDSDWRNQLLMAKHAAATAMLRASELQIAKQRLFDTQLIAPQPTLIERPEDGIYSISERLVAEGTMVRPGDALFKLVLGKTVKLRLSLQEIHSGVVSVGQEVEVSTAAIDHSLQGKVSRISPIIDPSTRTFVVEVEVPNDDFRLKPGGFAKAKILVGEQDHVATIPLKGLDTFAGVQKIFVIEQGIAKEAQVQIGDQTNEWVEIIQPKLNEGAIIATSAQRILSDGSAVEIRTVEETATREGDSK